MLPNCFVVPINNIVLLFALLESNTRFVFLMTRIITLQIRNEFAVILHRLTNGLVCSAKLVHEIFRVANGSLIATAKMILQRNKNSVSIIDIDSVGGTAPAIHVDLAEIIIPEFVEDIKMFYPSVIAISQLNLKTAIIFGK